MAKRTPLPRLRRTEPPRFNERWLALIALLAALILAVAAVLVRASVNMSVAAAHEQSHSNRVLQEIEELRTALAAADAGERGFLISGKPSALDPYQIARFQAEGHLAALRPLTYHVDEQYADVLKLEPLLAQRFDFLAHVIDVRQDGGIEAARRMQDQDLSRSASDPIASILQGMVQREQGRLRDAVAREDAATDEALVILVGALFALAVLALIFWGVLKGEFAARQRLERRLMESVISDEVTGAVNRNEFERLLAQEWAFRMRYHTPLALLLIDLDNFDEISSEFGLAAGDAVLRDVVRRLRGRLRTTERLARYGGQQFALLVPQPLNAAALLARQLVELMSSTPYPLPSSVNADRRTVEVELCVGVADASDVETDHDLVQAAGHALYLAKAAGPNHVESYRANMEEDAQRSASLRVPQRA